MTSPESASQGGTTLKVIDALDHPHGNRILRTRVVRGAPPTVESLKGASLRAIGPDGNEVEARVLGFPVFGGAPSTQRIRETGRVDLLVSSAPGTPIERSWEIKL